MTIFGGTVGGEGYSTSIHNDFCCPSTGQYMVLRHDQAITLALSTGVSFFRNIEWMEGQRQTKNTHGAHIKYNGIDSMAGRLAILNSDAPDRGHIHAIYRTSLSFFTCSLHGNPLTCVCV